jgi:hypothetical protein
MKNISMAGGAVFIFASIASSTAETLNMGPVVKESLAIFFK